MTIRALLVIAIAALPFACGNTEPKPGTAVDAAPESNSSTPGCARVPTSTELTCKPLMPGSVGCRGFPASAPDGAAHASEVFPLGCRATLPFESPAFKCAGGQPCDCQMMPLVDGGTEPAWICPL